jgi:predicted nicotinamide N-methyase
MYVFNTSNFYSRGAGILLAKMIDDGLIKVKNQDILELGSGTGLSGLVSGKMGGRTVMTGNSRTFISSRASCKHE